MQYYNAKTSELYDRVEDQIPNYGYKCGDFGYDSNDWSFRIGNHYKEKKAYGTPDYDKAEKGVQSKHKNSKKYLYSQYKEGYRYVDIHIVKERNLTEDYEECFILSAIDIHYLLAIKPCHLDHMVLFDDQIREVTKEAVVGAKFNNLFYSLVAFANTLN